MAGRRENAATKREEGTVVCFLGGHSWGRGESRERKNVLAKQKNMSEIMTCVCVKGKKNGSGTNPNRLFPLSSAGI